MPPLRFLLNFLRVLRLPPLFDSRPVCAHSARPLRGVGFALGGVGFAHTALVLAVDPGVSNLGSNTFFGVLYLFFKL